MRLVSQPRGNRESLRQSLAVHILVLFQGEDALPIELYEGVGIWQLHLYVARGTAGLWALWH